MNNYGKRVTPA